MVAFGFGGKLCSILPRKQRTLNVLSSPAHQEDEIFDPYKYNVGYAQITSVRDVVVQKENESANNRGLPARLSGRSAAGMVDVDTRCIGLFARAVAGEKIEDFAEALDTVATFLLNKGLEEASSMVRCIAEICKCNGKVAPKTGSPVSVSRVCMQGLVIIAGDDCDISLHIFFTHFLASFFWRSICISLQTKFNVVL